MKFVFLLAISLCMNVLWAQLPQGFIRERIATNLDPTKITLAPDGRIFMTEKYGAVRIIENGQLLDVPLLQLEVDNYNERGLCGIAIDPDFKENGFIYVFYAVVGANHNRVSRFTVVGKDISLESERILLEIDPMAGTIHNGGGMAFGTDGKLYIATGDGGDAGTAQNMENLLGKVLRINPDGTIPQDNPFFNQTFDQYRAIWALGFRNPFTFDIQPGSGKILVNDVGAGDWEEINVVERGANYGWPITEGKQRGQQLPINYKDPLYAYNHQAGCAITSGSFYNPLVQQFPDKYVGKYFFGDYCNGYLKVLNPNTGEVEETFATSIDRPIGILVAPNGDLYQLERAGFGGGSEYDNTQSYNGTLWRIIVQGSGAPFVAVPPVSVLLPVGEDALFSVAAYGNAPLKYQWQKNGIDIEGASQSNMRYPNVQRSDDGAKFRCIVTNGLGESRSTEAQLTVTNNTRPQITWLQPTTSSTYKEGDTIFYKVVVSDAEDGTIAIENYTWFIDLHHDAHTHPALNPISGIREGYFVANANGETDDNVWFRIYLRVTDSEGLTTVAYRDVFPQKVQFSLNTQPSGLNLVLDGTTYTSPIAINTVSGIRRTVVAPQVQQLGEQLFVFKEWSNGVKTNFYTFIPSDNSLNINAQYEEIPLSDGKGLLGRYFRGTDAIFKSTPALSRIDATVDFDWAVGSPDTELAPDFFSIQWLGEVIPLETGIHTFYAVSDDGVRLFVNQEQLINQWIPQAATETNGTIFLEAGKRYPIRMEYFEEGGNATARLFWSTANLPKMIIPKQQLYPILEPKLTPNLQLSASSVENTLELEIVTPTIEQEVISIYDLSGRQIQVVSTLLFTGINRIVVDISQLAAGIYFVGLQGTATIAFFKN